MLKKGPLITYPLSDAAKADVFSVQGFTQEQYLNNYVDAFLRENKVKRSVESRKNRTIRLIGFSVFALLLLIDIVYKALYHKTLLYLVIPAAGVLAYFQFRDSVTKYLKAEIKRRPDDSLDNILTSQISGSCRRLFTTLYGVGLIVLVLVLSALSFAEPHIVYEKNDMGGYSIRYYTLSLHNEDRIRLPEEHAGKPVNEIRGEVFLNMRFKEIELPSSLTEIRGDTFRKCKNLRSIEIPDGVTRIGGHAFDGCKRLRSVELPEDLEEIGTSAFRSCKSLEEVDLPYGLRVIGNNAFRECESLTEIDIPRSVEEIGDSAFRLCTGLRSVEIPDGVTSIGESTFRGCTELEEVTVPYSVKSVGRRAFAYCGSLSEIKIPKHATIDSEAFDHSPTQVYVYWYD